MNRCDEEAHNYGRGWIHRLSRRGAFPRARARVIVADNLSRHGAEANLTWLREQGVEEFVRADVADADAMNDLLARHSDADAVLHLAAASGRDQQRC